MNIGKTDYISSQILNYIFGLTPFAPPAVFYIGLFSQIDPVITELTNVNYPRLALVNDENTMPLTTTDVKYLNNIDLEFSPANSDIGIATHFGIFNDSLGAQLLYVGELQFPITINTGDIVIIKANNLWIKD